MKTAVSIPDGLFREVEELARRSGKTRSQVYREALAEHVRRQAGGVTARLDALVAELDEGHDAWADAASRRALERWEW